MRVFSSPTEGRERIIRFRPGDLMQSRQMPPRSLSKINSSSSSRTMISNDVVGHCSLSQKHIDRTILPITQAHSSSPKCQARLGGSPKWLSQHSATNRDTIRRKSASLSPSRWIMPLTTVFILISGTALVIGSTSSSQQQQQQHHKNTHHYPHHHHSHIQQKPDADYGDDTISRPASLYPREPLMGSPEAAARADDTGRTSSPGDLRNDNNDYNHQANETHAHGPPLCDDCLAIPLVAIMGDKQVNGFIIKPVPNQAAGVSDQYNQRGPPEQPNLHRYQDNLDHGLDHYHNINYGQHHYQYPARRPAPAYEAYAPAPPTPPTKPRHPFEPKSDDKCPMTGPLTVCDQIGSYPADEILGKLEVAKKSLKQTYFNIESLFSDERDHSSDPFDEPMAGNTNDSKRNQETSTSTGTSAPTLPPPPQPPSTTTITPPSRPTRTRHQRPDRGPIGPTTGTQMPRTTLISSNRSYGPPPMAGPSNANIDRRRYTTTTGAVASKGTGGHHNDDRLSVTEASGTKQPGSQRELVHGPLGAPVSTGPLAEEGRGKTDAGQLGVGQPELASPRSARFADKRTLGPKTRANYSNDHRHKSRNLASGSSEAHSPLPAMDSGEGTPPGAGSLEQPQAIDHGSGHLGEELRQTTGRREAASAAPAAVKLPTTTSTASTGGAQPSRLADQRPIGGSLEAEFLHLVERQAFSLKGPRQPKLWSFIGTMSAPGDQPNERPYQLIGANDYAPDGNQAPHTMRADTQLSTQFGGQLGSLDHPGLETIPRPKHGLLIVDETTSQHSVSSPRLKRGGRAALASVAVDAVVVQGPLPRPYNSPDVFNNETHSRHDTESARHGRLDEVKSAITSDSHHQVSRHSSQGGSQKLNLATMGPTRSIITRANSQARQITSDPALKKNHGDADRNKLSTSNTKRSKRQITRVRVDTGAGITSSGPVNEKIDPEGSAEIGGSGLPPITEDGGTPPGGPLSVQAQPICRAKSIYISPKVALNDKKQWKYVVNARERDPNIKQIIRVDICDKQKYAKKKLLALDAESGLLEVDTFFIPSCCVCQLVPDLGQPLTIENSSMLDDGQNFTSANTTNNQAPPTRDAENASASSASGPVNLELDPGSADRVESDEAQPNEPST